jgi:hypothetical protein
MMLFIVQVGLEALALIAVCLVVGISITTLGKVWPQAALTREQFSGLDAELEDVTSLQVEMEDTEVELEVVMGEPDELTVEVEVLDTATGQIADESLNVRLESE